MSDIVTSQVELTLDKLQPGQKAVICRLDNYDESCKRLMALGFFAGANVECLYSSPADNPTAYLVRGIVLALRKSDAAKVFVKLIFE